MTVIWTCVLLAALLPYLSVAIAKSTREYDNRDPRGWAARQTGFRERAYKAHLNAFEAFPFFATAVLAALYAGVDRDTIAQCSVVFILARLAYLAAYVFDRPPARSLAWLVGFACPVALMVLVLRATPLS